MSHEEYKQGYRDGFTDGYEKAKRDFTDTKQVWSSPYKDPIPWGMTGASKCSVCGMSWDKPMGFVCGNVNCPTKITCGTSNPTARFGSYDANKYWQYLEEK